MLFIEQKALPGLQRLPDVRDLYPAPAVHAVIIRVAREGKGGCRRMRLARGCAQFSRSRP